MEVDSQLKMRIAKLFGLFEELNIDVNTIEHPPIFSAQDGLFLHEQLSGAHCKSLLLCNKLKQFVLVVMMEQPKLDIKALEKQHNLGRLSFAKANDVRRLLGVEPGSLTPFGLMFDQNHEIMVILDETMCQHEQVNYHPLSNTMTTQILSAHLLRFIDHTGHQYFLQTLPLLSA